MNALALSFGRQRHERRRELQKQMNPQVLLERMRGADIRGKDEHGCVVKTKPSQSLFLGRDGAIVSFSVHADDRASLAQLPHTDADQAVKKTEHRKNRIPIFTDIFHAVRLFSHMRKSYHDELVGTEAICAVEALNASLAVMRWDTLEAEMRALAGQMEAIQKKMKRMAAATKIMAYHKIGKAKELLERALGEPQPERKAMLLSASCACLVAVRNRYESWRLKDVLKRGSLAYLRECSLRAERDGFMRNVLNELVSLCKEGGERAFARRALWEKDQRITSMLEGLNSSNMYETLLQVGKEHSNIGKSHISNARKFLDAGRAWNASLELRKLHFMLSANKPAYMAEQVAKSGESYLCEGVEMDKTFVAYLKAGAELFGNGVFDRAGYCFGMALQILDGTG